MKDSDSTVVYEFLYNSECCEGVACTVSIHRTLEGAKKALNAHKAEKKRQWEVLKKHYEKNRYFKQYDWSFNQWWGIKKTEVKD